MKINVDLGRRSLVLGAAAAGLSTAADAQMRTDTAPRELNGQPMPEPSPEQSAGPVRPAARLAINRQGRGGDGSGARHRARYCG